ncbi:MAG: hypothetical protein L6R42_002293 [Xanthoria sp. 1 TBL-2021]|nr:MAG: hypothetical protein L6R42_002293 [Xanthoria sp. 1 TBL-2021]
MASAAPNSTVRPPLTKSATAESLPPSLLSARRRVPTPSMSFNSLNSLNPFQAPRSNVSSPGSLYLSPPISTPPFMSPPPRLVAEDYLTSSGGKKKHSSRSGAVSKGSPLVLQGLPLHRPATPESDERPHSPNAASKDEVDIIASASNVKASKVHDQTQQQRWLPSPFSSTTNTQNPLKEVERPSMRFPREINESLAVVSLKRLSEFVGDTTANLSSETDEVSQPSLGVLGSLFRKSDMDPPDPKRSDDDQTSTTPWYGIRRRSTAPLGRDKRQSRKNETSPAILGLEIPATITLRKATGLFQLGPDPASDDPALTDQLNRTREGSITSPTICTLVDFDSRSLSNPDNDHQQKGSNDTANGSGLFVSNLSSKRLMSSDSRRQSLAETAITFSNIFPSPAILASPVSGPSFINEAERRFSVTHIKSRKSLHQVIWREDDISSSSETSSKSSSLTRPASIKLPDTSENSPEGIPPASSKPDPRHSSSPTLSEPGALTPDGPVTIEKLATSNAAERQPKGQMLRWSWAVAEDAPYDPTDSSEAAKSLHCTLDRHDEAKDHAPFGTMPTIPRLSIPVDEGSPAPSLSLGISRRGSFAVDTTSLASTTREREAGNRRSISITPLMLPRLGDGDANNSHDDRQAIRRCSRVE